MENQMGFSEIELYFFEALLLIALSCAVVPLARRLGLGSIIGYLIAGILAGFTLAQVVSIDTQSLLQISEFGVVLFLFVIGLSFRPRQLWELRGTIFGRGLIQLLATGSGLSVIATLYGFGWQTAIIIGFGLGLSSTPIVIKALDEAGKRTSAFGQSTIAVLLFEDLSIVPLLLLVALITPTGDTAMTMSGNVTAVLQGIAAIATLVIVAKFGLDPLFRAIAKSQTPELMTAAALGVVIFAALIMALVGLSYAMGAFIAGVMLAESSYRHQVEADIEPFRGLFLGLFFLAIGLSLDLATVADNWLLIAIATPVLVTVKGTIVYIVNRAFAASHENASRMGLALAQHGEFGFVLFAAATTAGLIDRELASVLSAIVIASMALSSQQKLLLPLLISREKRGQPEENFEDANGDVLVIGFGRFGQVVSQVLLSNSIPMTLLDADADRVEEAARFGSRVFFGDGTRRDVLLAAGANSASAVVIATDKPDDTLTIAALLKRDFPNTKIIARAYDRVHLIQLRNLGLKHIVRETHEAALALGVETLLLLGESEKAADAARESAKQRDLERLTRQLEQVRQTKDRQGTIDTIRPEPVKEPIRSSLGLRKPDTKQTKSPKAPI
ncbi:MAG: cation:proton antiporter [Pseudomonadota bacterium]